MQRKKGISLIVLVITIIVMIILAATIILAINNNNVVDKAKQAVTETNLKQVQELAQVAWAEGYVSGKKTQEELEDHVKESLVNSGVSATEQAKYNIEVTTSGVVVMEKAETETDNDLDLVERYFLGENKTGRNLMDIANMQTGTFIDEASTIPDASSSLVSLGGSQSTDYTKRYGYTKYKNKVYQMTIDTSTYNIEEVELYYAPEGKEGSKVEYDSNGDGNFEEWMILTDREEKLEIVSLATMYDKDGKGLELGGFDTRVTVTSDLDKDDEIGDLGDISIASYNNAIETINNFCKEIVTATDNEGVRSIGLSTDNVGSYNSTNFDEWYKGAVDIKAADDDYSDDLKLLFWGIGKKFGDEESYWVASREISEQDDAIYFGVRYVTDSCAYIFELNSSGKVSERVQNFGVRPIVINPTNIKYIE